MPLQATSGAASYDAFGGGVPFEPTYIEQIFSTHLYTGNGSTQTINNGIDLAGKGGLVWIKDRSNGTRWHILTDTVRGAGKHLSSNSTFGETAQAGQLSAFTSSGFSVGNETDVNASGSTYVSWTFREQPKFFDVVTFTLNGAGDATFSHSLGSVPGSVFIKSTGITENWYVYHRSLGQSRFLNLNLDGTGGTATNIFQPTSTDFTFGLGGTPGATYVAYLFAHNAGGFGLTGTDNVITCGSFTTDGSGAATVDLGYEPQWLTMKSTTASSSWWHVNNMAGFVASPSTTTRYLTFNTSDAEQGWGSVMAPTATGFVATGLLGSTTYIYIAIRRGPMRTPTTGTSVYSARTYNYPSGGPLTTTGDAIIGGFSGFPTDLVINSARNTTDANTHSAVFDRMRRSATLLTSSTGAEFTPATFFWDDMVGLRSDGASGWPTFSAYNYVNHFFRRAPGFFDEVCYTGTGGVNRQVTHNLGVQPELYIVKRRNGVKGWFVGSTLLSGPSYYMYLDLNVAQDNSAGASDVWGTSFPTSSYFVVSDTNGYNNTNTSGDTYVAYLFASCPGVSKVFNYTGNGSSQTINCGFTGGARFVMIKRTDSTGDWYVWDTARGIVANNDPHLSLNTTAAEVTTNDTIDTDSTGFVVNQVSATNVNVNGASYIGLAIA